MAAALRNTMSPSRHHPLTALFQAVAAHAGRGAIEPSDVAVAFKRQRLSSKTKGLTDLMHEHLPMECVDVLVPKARAVAK